MPLVYHAFKHILKKGNESILVNEREWGFATLTGDDLAEFTHDMAEVDVVEQNMFDTGEWEVEILPETHVIDGVSYVVPVGLKITFLKVNGSERPTFHPNYTKWTQVMLADPNLTYISPYFLE